MHNFIKILKKLIFSFLLLSSFSKAFLSTVNEYTIEFNAPDKAETNAAVLPPPGDGKSVFSAYKNFSI